MDFGTENAELFNIFTFLFLYSLPSCRLRMKNELVVPLRACLNFPLLSFYHPLFEPISGLFSCCYSSRSPLRSS